MLTNADVCSGMTQPGGAGRAAFEYRLLSLVISALLSIAGLFHRLLLRYSRALLTQPPLPPRHERGPRHALLCKSRALNKKLTLADLLRLVRLFCLCNFFVC
jgi:hypothetical protein